MKFIDSHAHLDFEQFHGDFNQVLERAQNNGVEYIINIGASLQRSEASVAIAEAHKNIFAVVGVHPEEFSSVKFESLHQELLSLAKSSKKVIGIGECGLDYYRAGGQDLLGKDRMPISNNEKESQQRLFMTHIEVAKHLSLPLVIHIRNGEDDQAAKDAYKILSDSGYKNGVVHCFTLNKVWAQKFTRLGFKLGFTGIVTYKNAEEIKEAVKTTDIKDILIETDCPFLAPQKFRGQRNEPSYVLEVAKEIADLKNISLEVVAESTTQNTIKLFKLK
jgi:TatD DNase family protein